MKHRTIVLRLMKRAMIFILLGAVTTIAVAWTFAIRPRGEAWMRNQIGVMVLTEGFERPAYSGYTSDKRGWAVTSYEGDGFKWAEGWPYLDFREFGGPPMPDELSDYERVHAPLIEVRHWFDAFTSPPSEADRASLLVVDAVGWPKVAMKRHIRHDLTSEIDALMYKPVTHEGWQWRMSEGEWWDRRRRPRLELMEAMTLPFRPLWPGFLFNTAVYSASYLGMYLWSRFIAFALRRCSIKSRLFILVSCGAIGTTSTAAIAWACAAWIDPVDSESRPDKAGVAGDWVETSRPYGNWVLSVHGTPGAVRIKSTWDDPDIRVMRSGLASFAPRATVRPAALVPYWGHHLAPPDQPTLGIQHMRTAHAFGWPFMSMTWNLSNDHGMIIHWKDETGQYVSQTPPLPRMTHGLELSPRARTDPFRGSSIMSQRALPLAIIWPGFTINSIAATCVLLTIVAGFTLLLRSRGWWRLRRGHCPACGYPIGTRAVCSECGHALSECAVQLNRM